MLLALINSRMTSNQQSKSLENSRIRNLEQSTRHQIPCIFAGGAGRKTGAAKGGRNGGAGRARRRHPAGVRGGGAAGAARGGCVAGPCGARARWFYTLTPTDTYKKHLRSETQHPKPQIPTPRPHTSNPKSQILNPKS